MADPKRLTLSHTGQAPRQLNELVARARTLGVSKRLAACLRIIQEELQSRPLEWGEPAFHIRSLGLISCVGFNDRIRVSYGVHEREPIVFVNIVEAQLGHPLYVPPNA